MAVAAISIFFQEELLAQIDKIANDEERTRSELIREAVQVYIEQKKEWENLFEIGSSIGATLEISEGDIMSEIKEYRKQKAGNTIK